jgi:hypothetical protein
MAMDAKDIQERIDGGFATSHVRNINVDTHIGQAPQRPFALLEDQMASVSGGYADLTALMASLKNAPRPQGLPDGAPNPNEIKEDGSGGYYRVVVSQEPREYVTVDGALKERIRFTKRRVASTMVGARGASEAGTPTDFWNGFTWLRDGYKPERDFQMILQSQQAGADEELVFDADASPTDTARLQHEMGRLAASRAPFPAETSKGAVRPSSRKED